MIPDRASEATGASDETAGFEAFARGDWETAAGILANLAEDGETPEVLRALAFCLNRLTDNAGACRAMERAFTLFRARGELRNAADCGVKLTGLFQIMGDYRASQGWERRTLRLIEEIGPCIERGYLALARVGCEIHDPADLSLRADVALKLAREFGDTNLELRALADKGLALVSQGQVAAGFALLDEVMVAIMAREMDDPETQGMTICAMLTACERTGDAERAEYWCERIEALPFLQHPILQVHCAVSYGVAELLCGRPERAEERLMDVLNDTQATRTHRVSSAASLAQLRLLQGRQEEAAAILRGFENEFEAAAAVAHLRMVQGCCDEAAARLRELTRGLGDDCIRKAPALSLLVKVELRRDDLPGALRAAELLREIEARTESNEIRALARLASGRIAVYEGDLDAAAEEFETGLTLLTHKSRPAERAEMMLELGQALRAAGKDASAAVETRAAMAILDRLGLVPEGSGAEAVPTGDAPPSPQAQSRGELTPRELEVARLVADGLTNREIAERLVLSIRTVETHVDRVLGKLDFHNRARLASWMREQAASGPSLNT